MDEALVNVRFINGCKIAVAEEKAALKRGYGVAWIILSALG